MSRLSHKGEDRFYARAAFLEVVRTRVPEVLAALVPIAEIRVFVRPLDKHSEYLQHYPQIEVQRIANPDLATAITAWGKEWSLSDDWLLNEALATIESWRLVPSLSGRYWQLPSQGGAVPDFPPPPAWNPVFESRSTYLANVDRYCQEVTRRVKNAGLVISRGPRSRTPIEWTVRYHLERESLGEIARSSGAGITANRVRVAIHEFAKLIGLSIR